MTFPAEFRRWLTPIAWFAIAALTFCIGRISSTIDAPAQTPGTIRPAEPAAPRSGPAIHEATAFAEPVSPAESTLQALTHGQPLGASLNRLLGEQDEIARMRGFLPMIDSLNTGEELEQALTAMLENNIGWSRSREYSMLLQKWAQINPREAITYVETLEDQGAKYGGYRAVLSTWARRSPQEAIAWADANGTDPKDGANGAPRDGNWAMATVIGQLSKTDADWALRLAEEQPISRARGRMVESLVPQLISQQGEAKAREVILGLTDESLRNGMTTRLVSQLAGSDPQGTAQWVTTLPAGEGRQRAMTELVAQWSENDPTAAAAFLSQFPASNETDQSRNRLAQNVLATDPEGALAWASTISEDKYRSNTISELVRNWMRRDTAAAQKWLQASPLAPDIKAALSAQGPTSEGGGRR